MKAAVYCRVSSDEQREKQSIETQVDFATRYAGLHEVELVDFYKDDGVSGGIPCPNRPQAARLLADARSHKFDVLLIYRVDRLSRSLIDLLQTAQVLEDYGVTLRSMTEPFDTSTPLGKFVLQLLGMLAELEKANIRDRSVTGSLRCAREGKWLGGPPPLGYKVQEGRLVVDPDGAALVERIFSLCVNDRLSISRITNLLNAEDVPMPTSFWGHYRKSRIWHTATVYKILKNRVYIGEHSYNKRKTVKRNGQVVGRELTTTEEQVRREVPPIIDPSTFTLAATMIKTNGDGPPANASRDYLLRGIIKCSLCGRSYVGVGPSDRNAFYYKCGRYMSANVADRCPAAIVRGDALEEEIWTDIVEFARNPGKVIEKLQAQARAQLAEAAPAQVELTMIAKSVDAKQQERANIIRFIRKGTISDAEAEAELTKLQQELTTLEMRAIALSQHEQRARHLQAKIADTGEVLRKVKRAAENADSQTKRELIKFLVNGVQINTVQENGKKKAEIHVSYAFDAPVERVPECIRGIASGRPLTTVMPASARPATKRAVTSRP